jgi:hypothetical protein
VIAFVCLFAFVWCGFDVRFSFVDVCGNFCLRRNQCVILNILKHGAESNFVLLFFLSLPARDLGAVVRMRAFLSSFRLFCFEAQSSRDFEFGRRSCADSIFVLLFFVRGHCVS